MFAADGATATARGLSGAPRRKLVQLTLCLPLRPRFEVVRSPLKSAAVLLGFCSEDLKPILASRPELVESVSDAIARKQHLFTVLDHAAIQEMPIEKHDLLSRIMRYIDSRLDDPALTPPEIAKRFGISVRYLHRIFSEKQLTVNGWRRARRLAKCRDELIDLGSRRTITEIALSWGFSDAAHFSRLFKSAFGMPPNAFRYAHRGDSRLGTWSPDTSLRDDPAALNEFR